MSCKKNVPKGNCNKIREDVAKEVDNFKSNVKKISEIVKKTKEGYDWIKKIKDAVKKKK